MVMEGGVPLSCGDGGGGSFCRVVMEGGVPLSCGDGGGGSSVVW